MLKRTLAGLMAALLLGAAASAVQATDLVIYHGWSSPAEVAALNVLKSGLAAKGDGWTDLAIPHDSGANVSLINLVTGGNPPNAYMESDPNMYRDLLKQGKAMDLTQWFTDNHVTENLYKPVVDAITVDGKIMKVPVALGIDGMVYYNMAVAKDTGVDPTAWKTLDDMFADFDKVKAKGYIPLAIGGQQWQVGYLTHALALAKEGPDFFEKIYGTKPDKAVFDTPEMKDLLDLIRKVQQNTDPGSPNRDWNVTTNLVITGKALMQLHGDWMKGEFAAAGKQAGTDFGCINIPGTKGLVLSIDAWGLLDGVPDDQKKAELDFASVNVDPKVQVDFAKAKGSTPLRTDSDVSTIDVCSQNVIKALKDPNVTSFPTPHNTADNDWLNTTWDVMFKFWSDPSMSDDDAIQQLKDGFDNVFS
jgi:glucose/mannose transport system substrate-binding protein